MKGMKLVPCLLALCILPFLAQDAGGQTEHDDSPRIQSGRGWIILSWYNSGTMAGWNAGRSVTNEPDMFMYPGWNALPSTNAYSNYTRKGGNAVAFGTWLLSLEGGAFNLSWSGPRSKSDDIVDMVYDPSQGPEGHLGVTTIWAQERGAFGAESSNYWPGANVPGETERATPRKIWNWRVGDYTPDDAFPEEVVVSKWRTGQNITVTRKAYTWSFQDFDDFIIVELYLENTGDATKEEVYVPLLATWNVSEFGERMEGVRWWTLHQNTQDDWFKYTDADNYQNGNPGGPVFIGADRAKGLKLSYQFDGNSPFTGYDDTGEPWNKDIEISGLKVMAVPNNFLASPAFVGMAPVAYANDAGIHSFNQKDRAMGYVEPVGEQPAYVNWWNWRGVTDFDEPTAEGNTPAEIFEMLTNTAAKSNPTEVGGFTNAQVYGPYTIPAGETAKLVVAYVAGTGAEYGGPGGSPIDPWQWALTATKADHAEGEQAIVEHLEHALFAYQSGYDLPDAPPDVDLVVQSDENAKVKVLWSAQSDGAEHPDYGEKDIAGYRVYRGVRGTLTAVGPLALAVDVPVGSPPPGASFNPNATWPNDILSETGIGSIGQVDYYMEGRESSRPGIYSWSDPNSNAGFSYWYSVRAYAKGHDTWTNNDGTKTFADLPPRVQKSLEAGLEGGYSFFLQKEQGSPVLPFVNAADRMERDIVVVPNPYMANGTNEYGGSIKLRFLNVPSKAYVYIFNSAGQLMQVLRKLDASRSEISWNGRPYPAMTVEVSAGIYFYAVHSLSEASLGQIKTGTFVVIK